MYTFRARQGGHIVCLACCRHGGARLHHFFQGLLLELHVLLAGFHQLGQFVVALFEQHVNIRPGAADVVLECDQSVIEHYRVKRDNDQNDQCDNLSGAMFSPLVYLECNG